MSAQLQLDEDTSAAAKVAVELFEREIGVTGVQHRIVPVGNRLFLKFCVGRAAPLYTRALDDAQRLLPGDNPFKGALSLIAETPRSFPESLEANALLTLLTRSTREVSEAIGQRSFRVPYIPFQNREDHQLAQAASHVVLGRRGAGKSTLIRRAVELLRDSPATVAVIDMQAYAQLTGADLHAEVLHDVSRALCDSANKAALLLRRAVSTKVLGEAAESILARGRTSGAAAPALKRGIQAITRATGHSAFVFLDDYHLVSHSDQPGLLHALHGALKGANGWLKVAGLRSQLNYYSAATREGLQIPGDAQPLSLDLTLENPEAAEKHLGAIAGEFMKAIGHSSPPSRSFPANVLRRLVWANAGVPRDFLQMLARALEHAQRNHHSAITISDVNSAIGEFGQRKLEDIQRDASNEAGRLLQMLKALETLCLEREEKVNAFLLRSEESEERQLVHALGDLRMVHLIQQSITPRRAGERYEAYILDYSIFTGFRRRVNVREMIPEPDESQFKAGALRALPKVASGFLAKTVAGSDA